MPRRRRAALALTGALALGSLVAGAPSLRAQVPPVLPTTTTAPGSDTTGAPSGSDLGDGSSKAPAGAPDAKGDGSSPPSGGIVVPSEAQRIIDAVPRTGPSDNDALLASLRSLRDLGLSEEESLRVGLGRFPIAGAARYSHDWLYPRYGPGFRFHLGTDVFADRGTPVRAPVDGIAKSAIGGLGGITVKVFMPDGTYFYLAHLAGLVDGFTQGMAVRTGDIVGYVGNSGNARGTPPHVHLGIYPRGGPPVDPKPVLDQFLFEAAARVPAIVEAYRKARPDAVAPAGTPAAEGEDVVPPLASASLLRDIAAGTAAWPIELLYVASANARSGPRVLVDLAIDDIVAGIDWSSR